MYKHQLVPAMLPVSERNEMRLPLWCAIVGCQYCQYVRLLRPSSQREAKVDSGDGMDSSVGARLGSGVILSAAASAKPEPGDPWAVLEHQLQRELSGTWATNSV